MRMRTIIVFLLAVAFLAMGCEQKAKDDKAKEAEKKPVAEGEEKAGEEKAGEEKAGEAAAEAPAVPGEGVESAAVAAVETPPEVVAPVVAPVPLGEIKNPFLAYVPADTTYLWATLSTLPLEEVPIDLEVWMKAYEGLAGYFSAQGMPEVEALVGAVLDEFKGKWNREGLASLGMLAESHQVIYGLGVFPVMRVQLADGAVFETVYARVEEKAKVQAEKRSHGEVQYRAYPLEDGVEVVVAILPQELVVTIVAQPTAEWQFENLFNPVANGIDVGTLQALATQFTGKGVQVGFIDMQAIYKNLVGDAKSSLSESLEKLGVPLPVEGLDGVCKDEASKLLATMPRLTMGSDTVGDTFRFLLTLELGDATHRSDLQRLAAAVPGVGNVKGNPVLAFGMGMDVAQTVGWLSKLSSTIQGAPYRCEALAFLNEMAEGLAEVRDPSNIPPFVLDIKGFNVVVENLALGDDMMPTALAGMVLIQSDSPADLFALAGGLVPGLDGVAMEVGKVVKLPAIPGLPPFLSEIHAMMTEKSLVIGVGPGQGDKLAAFAASAAASPAPILHIGYDYGRFFEILGPLMMAADPSMAQMIDAYKTLGMLEMGLAVGPTGIDAKINMKAKK